MGPLKRGPTPYYHQIASILREMIENGELRAGDRVPSEEQLCSTFKVSRATVRQALQTLEHDHLISREPGRGSFVLQAADRRVRLKMNCLLDDLIALGLPAETHVSELRYVEAPGAVAEAMGLEAGDEVFSFLRTTCVQDQPFAATRVYLPNWMGGRLTKEDVETQNLLNTLSRVCGVQGEEADQMVEAVMANASQAILLDVDAGSPLLSVSRTTYDRQHQCIEFSTTFYRSDRTRFYISQKKRRTGADDWVLSARGGRATRRERADLARPSDAGMDEEAAGS